MYRISPASFPYSLFPSCPADQGPDRQPHFVSSRWITIRLGNPGYPLVQEDRFSGSTTVQHIPPSRCMACLNLRVEKHFDWACLEARKWRWRWRDLNPRHTPVGCVGYPMTHPGNGNYKTSIKLYYRHFSVCISRSVFRRINVTMGLCHYFLEGLHIKHFLFYRIYLPFLYTIRKYKFPPLLNWFFITYLRFGLSFWKFIYIHKFGY